MAIKYKWLSNLGRSATADTLRADARSRLPSLTRESLSPVIVYGASGWAEEILEHCQKRGVHIIAVCDADAGKRGDLYAGKRILSFDSLEHYPADIPVIVASHRISAATQSLESQGNRKVFSLAFLSVIFPDIFPPHAFYDGLLEDLCENHRAYHTLIESLADETSRATLDAVLGYRQTFSDELIERVIDPDLYFPHDVITLTDSEIFVDCGAYNGDTTAAFIQRSKSSYKRIYAFEPDRSTFRELSARLGQSDKIAVFNQGVFSENGSLPFSHFGSRDASITTASDETAEVVSLDEILQDEPVTYIKLNVEGAEEEALLGAHSIIKRHRPKLAVSVYHRPHHLWRIPQLVHQLSPDYDLFLRQHDGGIIETVLYATPR